MFECQSNLQAPAGAPTVERRRLPVDIIRQGMIAGVAGGIAEIAWVWLYAAISGSDPTAVARGVTAVVTGGATAFPVTFGLVIHMSLAVVLGVALVATLRPFWLRGGLGSYGAALTALSVVWAVNFLVVLPQIGPAFVELLPYQVSLVSKLLFGIAATWAYRRQVVAGQERPELNAYRSA
jgi:hypothetical protein